MEERLNVLIAELDSQWLEIQKLHSAIGKKLKTLKKDASNEDLTNSVAYLLHNLYSAYEDILKLTAKFFENQIEDINKYHSGLLKRMLLEIKGIRPSLISNETFKLLDELRGFRHVFRHAYAYELDAERIIKLCVKSIKLKGLFSKDIASFKKRLKHGLSKPR